MTLYRVDAEPRANFGDEMRPRNHPHTAGWRLVRAGPRAGSGIRPALGGKSPGQKRAGVFRKLVTRVWA
jgi:hypothetical protein